VTISEVGTIILAARDMLRVNDDMEVQVEIRDQSGNQFPVEQLGRMELSAHTDNDIISVEKRNGYFLVRGTSWLLYISQHFAVHRTHKPLFSF
jgi:hypothetical protein